MTKAASRKALLDGIDTEESDGDVCEGPTTVAYGFMPVLNNSDKRKVARQALIFALLGWPVADLAVIVGLLISGTAHASTSDWLRILLQVGLIGVLAGLSVWAVYRLARSTMKL